MIDRNAREMAHTAVRRFAEGETTNDDFESEYPDAEATPDRSIRAIETMVAQLYSDHKVQLLTETNSDTGDSHEFLNRCMLFLRSDLEYLWPIDNFLQIRSVGPVLNALSFGTANKALEQRYQRIMAELAEAGDLAVWPFISRQDLTIVGKK